MANVQEINAEEFDTEVINSPLPVLVDFWAPWCNPCRMVAPIVERVAERFAGRIKVVKVNIDENVELATRFGIRGIPTLYLFRNGQIMQELVGAQPEAALVQAVEKVL